MNRVRGIVVLCLLIVGCASVPDTQESTVPEPRASTVALASCLEDLGDDKNCPLAGRTEMGVAVEPLSATAGLAGISESGIRALVGLKLHMAGIKIVPGGDLLYVRIPVVSLDDESGTGDSGFAFFVEVSFREAQPVDAGGTVTTLVTSWNAGVLDTIGRTGSGEYVRRNLSQRLDEFVAGWRTANAPDTIPAEAQEEGEQ